MKESLMKGLSQVRKVTVDTARTIGFMGEECRVYATPDLVRDIESTCRELLLEHADPGEDSVGSKVSITHSAPTLCGMEVEITVTVAEIDRSKVVFDVSAADPVDVICTGQHERFVVDVERTRQRLRAKAAKAAEAA
jgi:fluoroacetyl-CoA thioesterase